MQYLQYLKGFFNQVHGREAAAVEYYKKSLKEGGE